MLSTVVVLTMWLGSAAGGAAIHTYEYADAASCEAAGKAFVKSVSPYNAIPSAGYSCAPRSSSGR